MLPIYWEDDDEDDLELDEEDRRNNIKAFETWRDRITHLGLYVDEASFVFKLTERLPKDVKSNNPNRFVFTPMMKVDCSGSFMETRAVGIHTVHVSGKCLHIYYLAA